jgi:hypothetical protein
MHIFWSLSGVSTNACMCIHFRIIAFNRLVYHLKIGQITVYCEPSQACILSRKITKNTYIYVSYIIMYHHI